MLLKTAVALLFAGWAVPTTMAGSLKGPTCSDTCTAAQEVTVLGNCVASLNLALLKLLILEDPSFPTGKGQVDANTLMYVSIDGMCYDATFNEITTTGTNDGLIVELGSGFVCGTDILTIIGPNKVATWCYGGSCPGCAPVTRRNLIEQDALPQAPALNSLMETAMSLNEHDALYQDYYTKCAKHDFDVSIYVDSHLMAVASPTENAIAAGCPVLVTHSIVDTSGDTHTHGKEVLAWDGVSGKEAKAHFNADSYSIGMFKGSDLAKAVESVDITKVMQGKPYDIVSNNCAGFMMALAHQLDVKIDAKMTAFVARRLLQSSGAEFVNRIRNSVNFQSLFSGRKLVRAPATEMDDKEVIELLVEKSAGVDLI